MPLSQDLEDEIKVILKTSWQERDGQKVPEAEEVGLKNDAVKIQATVLYADLAESTNLVDGYKPGFAAKIYKIYLHCAAKIIRAEGGVITAFDGDRIMAVFIGQTKNTSAVRSALKINHAVTQIINPAIRVQYSTTAYNGVQQAVGVDTSTLYVARTGIRGSNDLVWVGRAANYAAKLCSLRVSNYASFITGSVYESMSEEVKYGGTDKKPMWEQTDWSEKKIAVYRSKWRWKP